MNQKCAVQENMVEMVEWIKSKTIVTITDLEKFYDIAFKADIKIEELINSRESWKNKYMELLHSGCKKRN